MPFAKGKRRLAAARRRGGIELPESPQHRAWRQSRQAATERVEEFRSTLRTELDQAVKLLERKRSPDSDCWHDLARRLGRSCERLGSATYCLYEWVEPDDARADIAPWPLTGRRNTGLW